jgi:hypothetical protein
MMGALTPFFADKETFMPERAAAFKEVVLVLIGGLMGYLGRGNGPDA